MADRLIDYLVKNGPDLATRAVVALIVLFLFVLLGRALGKWAAHVVHRQDKRRGETLAPVVRKVVRLSAYVAGAVMALDHLGIDIAALLAGAGIVGIAVGFGAQSLVKDVISGFFHIFDGVLATGDIVTLEGGASGMVEGVGLRLTEVRSYDGRLWYIPNGTIQVVGNFNRTWVRAIAEVSISYEGDVQRAMEVMREVGETWAAENPELVLEPPEVHGALGLNASDIGVRLVVKVTTEGYPLWDTERTLRRRIKEAFDASGVEIPFPRRVVYHRQEGEPLHVVTGQQREGGAQAASSFDAA